MAASHLTVTATNENPSTDPRIVMVAGSVSVTGMNGVALDGMVAVGLISNTTEAYVSDSAVTNRSANPALNVWAWAGRTIANAATAAAARRVCMAKPAKWKRAGGLKLARPARRVNRPPVYPSGLRLNFWYGRRMP